MDNKLPNIFKGTAPDNLNQTTNVINKNSEVLESKNINTQIKELFSSEKFVYKADVLITLNNKEVIEKTIIGKTNNSLITMDDELIDISKVEKIELL